MYNFTQKKNSMKIPTIKIPMVLDLVAANKVLHRDVNILPILETQLVNTAPARFYGCLDVVSGFDQLSITDPAMKYFNLMTTYGVFQLQFAPMGCHSTPVFFHQRMVDHIAAANYNKEGNGIVQWIDDTLIHAKDFKRYIRILEDVLRNLRKWKVRISPTKSILFTTGIEYCGRILQNGGWNYSKKYYEKILLVPKPEYVYELAKLLHLAQWLTSAVPEMAELRDKIMLFYPEMKGKKKKLLKEKKRILWNEELEAAFKRFKQRLADAAKARLQHYDRNMDLILVTDASDKYHSAILFQARQEERGKDLLKKTVYPMMFFSGKFDASQLVWGICHKELYPIIRTFNKLSYLLPFHPTAVQVYTDHLNLKAILQGGSKINHGHLNRLQRWMVILEHVLVDIHHVGGDSNIFADMLLRWAATPERERQRVDSIRIMRAAIRRDRKESDVSLGPQLSLTSRERKYYRRMFRHPLDIDEESDRWSPLKDKYTDSDSDSLGTGTLGPWYENDGISHGLRPDGGLEIKIEQPSLEEEYSRLALVDTESAVSLDEIGTWVSTQIVKSDNSSNEEVKIEVPRVGLDVLVSELRLSPKKQKEKLTLERMRALDKDRISCLNPYYHGEWKRISEKELLDAQKREVLGDGLEISEEEGRIIIPKSLFERQLVHIHLANRHGSRIQDVGEVRRFKWKISSSYGPKASAKTVMLGLRSNCIHCNRAPKLVKTNLRLVTEARRPKEVLVADFLYVNAKGYILVITDAFSRFCFLHYAPKADARTVVRKLSKVHTYWRLAVELTLVTGRGSHFANQLLELLQKEVRFTQNYAVSYASWTNGEVEIVHRKVLSFLRSLVSELRLQWDQWPDVIESVMTAVNEVPLPSRKLPGMKDAPSATLVDKDILYRLSMDFRRELDEMHSQVADYVSLMKRKRNEYWNKRQKRVDKACIRYVPGDWCLISTKNTPREGNKIKLIWSGPVNVIEFLSSNVYRVRLLNGETQIVHGSRLYFYEPDDFVPDDSLRKVSINNWGELEVQKKFAIDVSAAWVERLHPSLLHCLKDKEDLSIWGKLPGRRDFVSGWKDYDHKLIRNLILRFGMGSFEQFTLYMPYKSKVMMHSDLQRKLGRMDLAPLRGQFIDIDKGKVTSERFSLNRLEFNRRFDSLGSAKSFLKETCPEGVSQSYRNAFERKKKEVETMVKICEDRFIKL
eukprot:augustus_masked-scaffold_30-processed-gene-2.71-mRNA-1 protein AED:1.00 eAED:1.00 QI:0/0/0/0/1/1/3/0/1192